MPVQDYQNERLWGEGTLNGLAISVLLHVTAVFLMVIVSCMMPSTQTTSPLCMVDLLWEDTAGGAGGGESGTMRAGDGKPEPPAAPLAGALDEPTPERPDAVYLSDFADLQETPPPVPEKVQPPPKTVRPKAKPEPKPIRPEEPRSRPHAAASSRPKPDVGRAGAVDVTSAEHGKGAGSEDGSGSAPADSGQGSGTGLGTGAGTGSGGGAGHGSLEASFGSGNGPRFAVKTLPKYPRLARELGKEGTVLLRLTIDERGRLMDVEVLKRAGSGFDEEAVRAVRESSFSPARIDGKPVRCRARLPIRFVLNEAKKD